MTFIDPPAPNGCNYAKKAPKVFSTLDAVVIHVYTDLYQCFSQCRHRISCDIFIVNTPYNSDIL